MYNARLKVILIHRCTNGLDVEQEQLIKIGADMDGTLSTEQVGYIACNRCGYNHGLTSGGFNGYSTSHSNRPITQELELLKAKVLDLETTTIALGNRSTGIVESNRKSIGEMELRISEMASDLQALRLAVED